MSDAEIRRLERLAQHDPLAQRQLEAIKARLVDEEIYTLGWALRYGKDPIWHLILGQKQFVENLGYSLNHSFTACKTKAVFGAIYPTPRSYMEAGIPINFRRCKKCMAKAKKYQEEKLKLYE